MKTKLITMLQKERQHEQGHRQLIRSLEHFGYDYHVIDPQPYRGFGDKLIRTAEYVRSIRDEYTHFIFLDGTDTFALAPLDFAERTFALWNTRGILVSCEKALWPWGAKKYESRYAQIDSPWKYPNSGSYFAFIDTFLDIWDRNQVGPGYDDQQWFHDRYGSEALIRLDFHCLIFQSIAFKAEGEFSTESGYLVNQVTGSMPIFVHGNGGTKMDWIWELL